MSGRLCLSSTSSCDPMAAAFLSLLPPQAPCGEDPHSPLPARPSGLLSAPARQTVGQQRWWWFLQSHSHLLHRGVHTERCNAAIPDFPLISPPPLALKACIQLMASEEYPLIFRGKDSCKNAIPSAQEPAAPPPGIPAHSPPSQVGREVPPAPRHPAQK